MNRYDKIIAERTVDREAKALTASRSAMERMGELGYDVKLIGSLARGDFMAHSDVDFFVRSEVQWFDRVAIERAVAQAFAGSEIPFDIVFRTDLVPEQAEAFEHGTV